MSVSGLSETNGIFRPTVTRGQGHFDQEGGEKGSLLDFARVLIEAGKDNSSERSGTTKNSGNGAEHNFLPSARTAEPRAQKTELEIENYSGTADAQYTSQVLIGDHAVAFSARPIVAPAAVRFDADYTLLMPTGEQAVEDISQVNLRLDQATLTPPIGNFAMPGAAGAESTGKMMSVRPANIEGPMLSRAVAAMFAGRSPGAALAAYVSPAIAQSSANTGRAGNLQGKAAAAQPSAQQQAGNPVFAQLIASPAEYRIVVRGQRLSASEREQIVQDMSRAFARLGLPFNPVRFLHAGQEF